MALDIIFISFDEINADINFHKLHDRFPYAKRINGVKGIAEAHKAASKAAETRLFYVVDGDSEILDSFDFSFKPPEYDQEYAHIWKSRNAANNLEYGYGGIKLFSKQFFKNLEDSPFLDFSTSLTSNVKYIDEVASITHFNADEFQAWRSAFRECAKLASKQIKGQIDEETEFRLKTWKTFTVPNCFYSSFILAGANEGSAFGETYANDYDMLSKINDFEFLTDLFEQFLSNSLHTQ